MKRGGERLSRGSARPVGGRPGSPSSRDIVEALADAGASVDIACLPVTKPCDNLIWTDLDVAELDGFVRDVRLLYPQVLVFAAIISHAQRGGCKIVDSFFRRHSEAPSRAILSIPR